MQKGKTHTHTHTHPHTHTHTHTHTPTHTHTHTHTQSGKETSERVVAARANKAIAPCKCKKATQVFTHLMTNAAKVARARGLK